MDFYIAWYIKINEWLTARPAVCILAVYFFMVQFKVAVQSEKEKETEKRKKKEKISLKRRILNILMLLTTVMWIWEQPVVLFE